MLVRYCMTYHHYNLYFIMSLIFFCFIMKIARPPLHPTWPGLGGVHLPVNPSLLVHNYKITSHWNLDFTFLKLFGQNFRSI